MLIMLINPLFKIIYCIQGIRFQICWTKTRN